LTGFTNFARAAVLSDAGVFVSLVRWLADQRLACFPARATQSSVSPS
jgi:hypothetical protein